MLINKLEFFIKQLNNHLIMEMFYKFSLFQSKNLKRQFHETFDALLNNFLNDL